MTGMATKMRSAGYQTHAIGKWDAGMATPDHTPQGRGYDSWIGYYQHANDYFTKGSSNIGATGEVDNCLNRFTDLSELNATFRGGVRDAHALDNNTYEEDVFKQRALDIVAAHPAGEADAPPLFLFYAFHLLHTPLEIPPSYLDRIDQIVKAAGGAPIDSQNRRLYAAMVLYLDEAVGALVAALKQKGMWDNTILAFITDNGGPIYEPGAANNYPLRGGKYSDWEGGIRSNAFVSGGYIPADARGTTFSGVVSIADWYAGAGVRAMHPSLSFCPYSGTMV